MPQVSAQMRLFFILLLSFPFFLGAQVEVPQVSASALAYGKYADIPVSHFNGSANVSIPLHTVTEGPLSLAISLNYHTSGLTVSSPASKVGLGWNLRAGGMISRTARGFLDDRASNNHWGIII